MTSSLDSRRPLVLPKLPVVDTVPISANPPSQLWCRDELTSSPSASGCDVVLGVWPSWSVSSVLTESLLAPSGLGICASGSFPFSVRLGFGSCVVFTILLMVDVSDRAMLQII